MSAPEPPDGHSLDAFHRGRFMLVQPKGRGHRSGVDAMLLAACVPDGFVGHVADLGAGAGAAGLAVLSRCEQAQATLFENAEPMLEAARLTLARPENAEIAARATLVCADVGLDGRAREAAGLARDAFDAVILNPPFNDARDRATPDALKAGAHVMDEALLARWLKTACAILKPGGLVAVIARPRSLQALLAACAGRFGALAIRPVHPHPQAPAIRILLTGAKQSRKQPEILPGLVLHPAKGVHAFTAEADAVNNGRKGLAQVVESLAH